MSDVDQDDSLGSTVEDEVEAVIHRDNYLMKRLTQIFRSQTSKNRMVILSRYFHKWSDELPLNQKCDEITKQLRERMLILDTLRSSYLRDVVSVKNYLVHISKFKLEDNIADDLQQMKDGLYDLHTVPSIDLRTLVKKAKESSKSTSAELMDNLIEAGVVDPETCRTLNPWEQSRGYKRVQRIRKGPGL